MSTAELGVNSTGPIADLGGTVAIDHGAIGSLAVLEATGAIATLRAGLPTFCDFDAGAAMPAGLMFSHAACRADGTLVVGMANLTGAPVNPAAQTWGGHQIILPVHQRFGGQLNNNLSRVFFDVLIDWPNIGAATVAEEAIGANANPAFGIIIAASPVDALPAGLALSHVRGNAFNDAVIGMANISAAPIDPGPIMMACMAIQVDSLRVRTGASGPLVYKGGPSVTIDSGAIGANTVLETSFSFAGCGIGDVMFGCPTAALPAGIALSHFRVSAPGVAQCGLANLTGAPIDPGAITFILGHCPRPASTS